MFILVLHDPNSNAHFLLKNNFLKKKDFFNTLSYDI